MISYNWRQNLNRAHHARLRLALGVRCVQPPECDPTESIEVVLADFGAFVAAVRDESQRLQALDTASLWLALNWIERSTRRDLMGVAKEDRCFL
jgi:hypothetical protein